MPLLLADFIYSRDCKLNLRKNVDTTIPSHISVKKERKSSAFFAILLIERRECYGLVNSNQPSN